MLLVPNGTRTGKPGRPIQRFGKRGHERIPRQPCKQCMNFLHKLKYHSDPEHRARKLAAAVAYNKAFREEHGYWPSKMYD